MSVNRARFTLGLFALTIFVNAWLLFWIQPLLAKMVLPFLGGSPAVWNTCMMFFQGMLLIGYLYAHLSARILPIKFQPILQGMLLGVALAFLPFVIHADWQPNMSTPITSLLAMLVTTAVIPLLALNAGSPLLQRWFHATDHPEAHDPYFLFSVSNAGCTFALLAFLFILEPTLSTTQQNWLWAAIFSLLLVLTIVSGAFAILQKSSQSTPPIISTRFATKVLSKDRIYWLLLAFVPSSLLLGVTTHITTDIASAPLLWVIPFILFLLSFIIAFSRNSMIKKGPAETCQLAFLLPFVIIMLYPGGFMSHVLILFFHLGIFFFTCLVLNLELVARRPHPKFLTEFYLWMALGGFLGGVFNALIAPSIFLDITEYPMMMAIAILLKPPISIPRKFVYASTALFVILYFTPIHSHHKNSIFTVRNFFGTSRVVNLKDEIHTLMHGTTLHGLQLMNPKDQKDVLSYYHPLVSIFNDIHKNKQSLKVGIVGLGAGITACLAKNNDRFTFYEINPAVIKIAQNPEYFTFLSVCPPKDGIIMGDARLKLQQAPNDSYDILVLDAFSSDAIPIHLLTKQAVELYLSKIKKNGVILVHISNRYLDLKPIISAITDSTNTTGIYLTTHTNKTKLHHPSIWVLVTKDINTIDYFIQNRQWEPLQKVSKAYLWTDDHSNIFRIIRLY